MSGADANLDDRTHPVEPVLLLASGVVMFLLLLLAIDDARSSLNSLVIGALCLAAYLRSLLVTMRTAVNECTSGSLSSALVALCMLAIGIIVIGPLMFYGANCLVHVFIVSNYP